MQTNPTPTSVKTFIADQTIDWETSSQSGETPSVGGSYSALSTTLRAASKPEAPESPAPPAPEKVRSFPKTAATLKAVGGALAAAAAAASFVPALVPLFVSWQAALVFTGLGLMAAAMLLKSPGSMPDAPRGPPSDGRGYLGTFKALWAAAQQSGETQKVLADRAGGLSWTSWRSWSLGFLRTGLTWMGVALMTMLSGSIVFKLFDLATAKVAAAGLHAAAASTVPEAVGAAPFSAFVASFVAPALAQEVGVLFAFFGVEWAAKRLGAGRFAPWVGGAAALALAAAPLLALGASPFIVVATLSLEAGVVWCAARTRSLSSALALRGLLSLFSIESARLVGALAATGGAALVGLPAVWGGVLVGLLALAAWALKSPALRLGALGDWWRTPEPHGAPKSPWPILSAGLVWGLAVYAVGDLLYWAVNWFLPGSEPAPSILAKMLTARVDLVLFNFALVGVIEEFVFRRGLYKSILDRLAKWKVTGSRGFWLAAVSSGLIFSGVHYVDWGAMLAHLGWSAPGSTAAVAGAYAFTWAGFVSRAALGVVLAGLYRWSGVLLVPIAAHFWADSMEGLGLRWGFPAFLMLAAGALAVSFLFRLKSKPS